MSPLSNCLLIFDLPGQVELYINECSLKHVIERVSTELHLKSCIIELFDCSYLYETNDFISLCMMSLCSLVNFNLPHVNILNKIDLMQGRRPETGRLNDYFLLPSVKEMVEINSEP